MRTLLIAAIVASTLLAPAAQASTADLLDFKGEYQLADGRILTVSMVGRRLFAQLDGLPPAEVVAAGDATFVSRQGNLQLAFVQHANGVVTGVTVRAPAPASMARQR